MMNTEMEDEGERQNRVLLRPWLENMLEGGCIPGLEWFDAEKTMFKVPWKHRSKKDWSMRHSGVFLEWAKNTGRWSYGDVNFAQLKTRLRCAFNKAPDIEEMKEFHSKKGEEPFKVYRFTLRKDVSGRRTNHRHRANISSSSSSSCNQLQQLMSLNSLTSLQVTGDDFKMVDGVDMDTKSFRLCPNLLLNLNVPITASEIVGRGPQSVEIFSPTSKDRLWKHDPSVKESLEGEEDVKREPSMKRVPSMIPVCVELLTSDSSNLSNSDSGSPLIGESLPDSAIVTSGAVETERETEFVKSVDRMEKVGSDGGGTFYRTSSRVPVDTTELPKEHMLRVASLFVEADKKRSSAAQNLHNFTNGAIHTTGQSVYSKCIVVTPDEDQIGFKSENRDNAADISQLDDYFSKQSQSEMDFVQVIDLNDEMFDNEPIDLTKRSSRIQNKDATDDWINSSKRERMKEVFDSVVNEASSEIEDNVGLDFKSNTLSSIEQLQSEELFLVKEKFLTNWELRLRTWEERLKAREETYYWRSRCFEIELASRGLSFKTLSPQMLHVPKHKVDLLGSTLDRLSKSSISMSFMPREVKTGERREPSFAAEENGNFVKINYLMKMASLEDTMKPTSKTTASKIRLKLASKKQLLGSSAYNASFILPKVDPKPNLVPHHRTILRTDDKEISASSVQPRHVLPEVVICESSSSPVVIIESSHHLMSSSLTCDEEGPRILPKTLSSYIAVDDGAESGCLLADSLSQSPSSTNTKMSSVAPVDVTTIDSDTPTPPNTTVEMTCVGKIETTGIFYKNNGENCQLDVLSRYENRGEDTDVLSDSENELVIQTSDEEMADDLSANNRTPIKVDNDLETLPSETKDCARQLCLSTDSRSHPSTTEISISSECDADDDVVVSKAENVSDPSERSPYWTMPGKGRILSVEEFQSWLKNRTTNIYREGTLTGNEFIPLSVSRAGVTTTDHDAKVAAKEDERKKRKHEDEEVDDNRLKRSANCLS